MTAESLRERLKTLCAESLPNPGRGQTHARFERLVAVGREDLSLVKLAEAHWDAVAILAEAGRAPVAGAIYAVWASEIPGRSLALAQDGPGLCISGTKAFCSGVGLVDRALITVGDRQLVEIDLRAAAAHILSDGTAWKTEAFRLTCTSAITCDCVPAERIGGPGWYVQRAGLWHGGCGIAACWAGGAAGLLDWAMLSKRDDPHTLAHLGAMHADVWAMQAWLAAAAREIDAAPTDGKAAMIRALTLRHLIEQACTDLLRRFGRAYGPHPLALDAAASRRMQELELYLRQSHAERDLEALGRAIRR